MGQGSGWGVEILSSGLVNLVSGSWNGTGYRSGFWRLYHNLQGGAMVASGGVSMRLEAGGVYLVPEGVTFDIGCSSPTDHMYVHFDLHGVSAEALRKLFASPARVPNDSDLAPEADRLRHLLAQSPASETKVACQALALVYGAMARHLQALPDSEVELLASGGPRMEMLRPALWRIGEQPQAKLPVGSLARECGLSREHFSRVFRETLGVSPAKFVQEARVKAAEHSLLTSARSIEAIAEECGFGTREYFTRVFTRLRGCAPGTYRARRKV